MNHWTGFSRTAIAAAVAIVAVAPALAQNTTSAINGRITDADGKPVAGAAVSIVHVESGSTSNVVTDAEGRYAARGLRAGGPFTITVSKGGQTEKREGVFLALAETLSLDATLGAPPQSVTITGRRASDKFNSSTMGSGTGISSRDLASMPSISGSLQDFARADPRLAQTDKQRGEISALGQNTRYNSITIDGVTTNDTFGLEANNLPTLRQPVSLDAIQSVQVNLSNYDVTQKGYTGANINAVTKSGTNEFHGNVHYVWRSSDFVGQRFNRTSNTYSPAPDFKEFSKGVVLGGPIIKDKLFFFASYDEFVSTRSSPAFGPLGSNLTNVGISQTAINSAISTARTTWGMDVGTSAVPTDLKLQSRDTLLKLDWNINDDHRANLRYTKTVQNEPTLNGFSQTGLSLSSWWFNQAKTIESLVGQWFADWTPSFSTELKASKRDYESVPTPFNGQRQPAIGLRFSGTPPEGGTTGTTNRFLNFGTENSRHLNVLRTKTSDLYAGATWNLGAHELKGGVDYSKNDVYNAFLQNIFGNYTFACEPGTYSFGTVGTTTTNNCNTITPAQRDQAVLENFQRGLPSAYTLQAALPGRVIDDAVATWRYESTGVFLQDSFKITPALSVMGGVRVDMQKVPTKPIANASAAVARTAGQVTGANAVVRDTGGFGMDNTETLDGTELVQPRLGFNWKLDTEERRMQVRGGVGLFQGAAANVWLSNPFSNTGAAVTTFSCTTFAGCNPGSLGLSASNLTPLFRANPDQQQSPGGTPPAANIDFISSKLEQPSVWKLNLAFDTELNLPMVGTVVAGAEWMHTKTKAGIFYKHLNLGDPTKRGPDGRDMFWMPQSYDPTCWLGSALQTTGTSPTTGVSCAGGRDRALSNASWGRNVLLAEKTSQGGGDALTFSLSQPAGPAGFSWSVAYTYTTAKEMSPLTSSTSSSNWSNRNIFNPNEEVLQNSNYLTKDRVNAMVAWSKAFVGNYRTTVGVFYEGRRGKPYSWTYLNDMNGDGISGNDLMFIPGGVGDVLFKGGANEEAQFWQIVNGYKGLSKAKGGVVGRNDSYAPWVNNFDLKISQEVPGFTSKHKGYVSLDILNFGNFLDKRWGRINEIDFPSSRGFVNYNGIDPATGKYMYALGTLRDWTTRQVSGESQWAAQVTLRYEF